jgi:hypothetical protein
MEVRRSPQRLAVGYSTGDVSTSVDGVSVGSVISSLNFNTELRIQPKKGGVEWMLDRTNSYGSSDVTGREVKRAGEKM